MVPYFIEELLRTTGDEENRIERHANLLTALVRLHRDVVPPLLASLDTHDKFLQAELIDVLRMRGDERAVDYLWYLSASPKSPDFVRKRATETLEMFLNTRHLPDAREELTKIAERYYLKKVEFPDREKITFWRWEGKRLVTPPETLSASQVEELLGLRFARQALDLDPTYEPAQRIFLSLALDKAYERVGIDQPLEKLDANVRNLLRSVNPQLLMDVLERAMSEHRLTVVLGVVRTLGDLAETRAAMPKFRESSPLIRALSYPDRRVQLSAADALLRIPGERPAIAAARIVQVLRRAAAAPGVPKVLIGDFDHDRAIAVAGVVKKAGFEPVIAGTGREVMQRLAQAADIDALLIDESIPNPVLRHLLAQIRADMDNGLLPLFIMARRTPDGGISPKSELTLSRLASYYRYVWVIPSPRSADALKEHLQKAMAQTFGKPLAEQERLDNATLAMVWLRRMGTEEVAGFDIRSAEATILASFRSEMLGTLAMEAALGLPGRDPQRELAGIVLDKTLKPEKRTFAASQLNRHIQKYGILLTLEQIRALRALYDQVDEPRLKANVALVLGSLRPNTKRTGNRLLDYYPSLPAKKDAGPNPMPQPKKP
ncbi:MAG: hypothetical protein KatS3mg105_1222 [Gemmatales bacterium]|nr:MAG: hypothetical protein KatS3mg105_1222 [Gemmatales bacterium]